MVGLLPEEVPKETVVLLEPRPEGKSAQPGSCTIRPCPDRGPACLPGGSGSAGPSLRQSSLVVSGDGIQTLGQIVNPVDKQSETPLVPRSTALSVTCKGSWNMELHQDSDRTGRHLRVLAFIPFPLGEVVYLFIYF